MSERKKTTISLLSSVFALMVSVAVSFFLSRYVVRELGEEANGFAQLANNFVSYATLITISLNSMAGRFIAISYHHGETDKCRRYYSSLIVGNMVIVCALLFPAVLCVTKLEKLIKIETANVIHVKILFSCVFLNFGFSQITGFFTLSFFVRNAQYIQNAINILRALLNATGLLLLFTFLTPRIFYVSMVGILLTILFIPAMFYCKKKLLPDVTFEKSKFGFKCIREMIFSGIWNTVTQCGNLLMTGFDLLLSNIFIGPLRMGVLAIAKTVPTFVSNLGINVNAAFAPEFTMAYASGDKKRVVSSLRYSMKCSSFVMSIVVMALCVYGTAFYGLWMPTMNAHELTILSSVTCIAFVPLSGTQTLYNVFTAANKLKINSLSIVIGGVVNILVVLVLLKYTSLELYAIAGVSSIVSIVRNLLVTIPYSAFILGLKWYTFYVDVGISVLCCAISGSIFLVFSQVIVPSSWGRLFLSVMIASLFISSFLFVVLLSHDEKAKVFGRIRRKNG